MLNVDPGGGTPYVAVSAEAGTCVVSLLFADGVHPPPLWRCRAAGSVYRCSLTSRGRANTPAPSLPWNAIEGSDGKLLILTQPCTRVGGDATYEAFVHGMPCASARRLWKLGSPAPAGWHCATQNAGFELSTTYCSSGRRWIRIYED
jgi:hypothetical protein